MLPNILPRILILLRIAIKSTPVMAVMLNIPRITVATGNIRSHVRTLGLGGRIHGVTGSRHDLAGLADVTGRARQVGGIVRGEGG